MLSHINSDQRRHPRYPAKEGAIALSPLFCGKIIDISQGGLAIQGVWKAYLPTEFPISIITENKQFYISNIPVMRCWSKILSVGDIGLIITQKAGLQFQEKEEAAQTNQELNRFIDYFIKTSA